MKIKCCFLLLILLLSSCAKSQDDELKAVQNMNRLQLEFKKLKSFKFLNDTSKLNGYVSFFVEPGTTEIKVMLVNRNSTKNVNALIKAIKTIAENNTIKNNIVIYLFSRLKKDGSLSSTDIYKKIAIQ